MARLNASLRMMRHEILSSKGDMGIEVVSGCVWLTHMGCAKDWILQSGDKAMVWARRGSVIYALDESEIWVESQGARAGRWGALEALA